MLQELGVPFEVLDPDIDEKAIRKESPEDLVMALAHAKADALLERLGPVDEPLYLVTADQVVVYNDTIREKPTSEAEAREFISGYSKAPAKRVGAIVVNHLGTGKTYQSLDIAEVRFQPIPENVIDILIKEGTVYKIAGGLMVEHELVLPLVSEVYGTMDSIIGLGKHVVAKLLLEAASDMQEMQES
ncbi:hypothetical protein CYMTET_37808 [Cymbomonas tetramitiformis]|uniref:Maf-like protein n=1 Tax=Cymbomonas tetramitiformis TaxID=36881 RepID=A0AAE0CDC2_9CHLO|nr:hypothetical protein CYMTET_37808 [Cymbomonas tetramitiformis]|eukprot:gene10809-12788_t